MTFDKISSCVTLGLCKWVQVRETLRNAQLSDAAIALFMAGTLTLDYNASAMVSKLIANGVVPTPVPRSSYVSAGVSEPTTDPYEDVEVPELLYCLNVLRTIPTEALPVTMDAMFGSYRRIDLTEAWVRERFGECDTRFGPHRFLAYRALEDRHHFATVWARDGESDDELLKAQLTARFDLQGVLSLRREVE
jgi:hypothetical protein